MNDTASCGTGTARQTQATGAAIQCVIHAGDAQVIVAARRSAATDPDLGRRACHARSTLPAQVANRKIGIPGLALAARGAWPTDSSVVSGRERWIATTYEDDAQQPLSEGRHEAVLQAID